jgi:hypothetical protein
MNAEMGGVMPTMAAYDVFLNSQRIDTVFFQKGTSTAQVADQLIRHDMYDPDITVEEVR